MKRNSGGFSLIEVLVAIAILGGASLLIMQLGKNSSNLEAEMNQKAEDRELKAEIDFILDNPKSCTASFKGTTFKGSTIKSNPVDVELWISSHDESTKKKKFSATDKSYANIGRINLTDIELSLPNYTTGTDFPPGTANTEALLQVSGHSKVMGKNRNFKPITKNLRITFNTDATGNSTIDSCSAKSSTGELEKLGQYKTSCIWDSSSGTTTCTPPLCLGGDVDQAVGCEKTYDLWGGSSGYQGGNCYRTCLTQLPSPMFLYLQECSSGGKSSNPCSPNACKSGEIDKGVSCINKGSAIGGPSGTHWGSCRRQCFAPSPF